MRSVSDNLALYRKRAVRSKSRDEPQGGSYKLKLVRWRLQPESADFP